MTKLEKGTAAYIRWYDARVTHGGYIGGKEQPTHYIWRSMVVRATEGHKNYEHVKVCDRWLKYENFLADMGERPSPKHTLDRWPDQFGNYEPSNCRWATWNEQHKNKRTTRYFEQDGKVGTLSEWALWLGMSTAKARYRWEAWGTFFKGQTWKCVPPNHMKKLRLISGSKKPALISFGGTRQ